MIRLRDSVVLVMGMTILATYLERCAAKPFIRTTTDIAVEICESSATAKNEAQKQGISLNNWCNALENLQPFIDAFLSARKSADKATLNRHAPDGQDATVDGGAE